MKILSFKDAFKEANIRQNMTTNKCVMKVQCTKRKIDQ